MPIAQIWTLKDAGGTEQPLAAWGIDRAILTRVSQGADTLQISVASAAFDADELFAFDGVITLYRYPTVDGDGLPTGTGVPWFAGRCVRTPRTGRPAAEGMNYEFQGPWLDLEQAVFQQTWTVFSGSSQTTGPQSRVNLASSITGALITTAAQITAALAWAVGAGANLQAGSLPTGIYIPAEQGTDLTCAEVILRMLRWMPDVVTWFDYTTSPPTLNMANRASLTALNLAVAGLPAEEIDITARHDLVPPVVVLKYSQTNAVNGEQTLNLLTEKYPTGQAERQRRAVVLSIDLQGARSSYLTQKIVAPAIDATNAAWWQLHCPELNDATIASLSVLGGTDAVTPVNSGETAHANELKDGAIADWMNKNTSEVIVTAQLTFNQTTVDGAGSTVTHKIVGRTYSVRLISTDASSNTYQSIGSASPADPKPANLAQSYYAALSQLHYEGTFAIVEQEVGTLAVADTGAPYSNRVLNLTGGLTEWLTMAAQIYEVTEDLGSGRTTLRFGPPKHLSPADLVAQLRASRTRVIPELAQRSGGIATGGGQTLPGKHKDQASAKVEATPDLVVTNGSNTVTVRLTGLSGAPAQNLTMLARSMQICDGSGAYKNVLVLSSETF
jgi:hypothetical protein